MIPYTFHPEAEDELDAAAVFYESRMTGLGSSFLDAVERTIGFIREYPEIGRPMTDSIRQAVVRGFPYAVVYRGGAEQILVLAIAHLRRRPNSWRTRQ